MAVCAIGAACAVGAVFHDNHFVLLLVITVLLYSVATLGLNVQFGYAGVLNFAGASFFGIGAYTSAVLNAYTAVPHLLVLWLADCWRPSRARFCCCRCCERAGITRRLSRLLLHCCSRPFSK